MSIPYSPRAWMAINCPPLDGQFLFLDPLWWDTHLLSAGAVEVLTQAAEALEESRLGEFIEEVQAAGGWPPGLERLVSALASLDDARHEGGAV